MRVGMWKGVVPERRAARMTSFIAAVWWFGWFGF
jgi:hypothetical protein